MVRILSIRVGIVGAGPAGMAAALYLKRSGINPVILEKSAPGGQMINTFKIENYLGVNEINGADLSLKMFEQLMNNNIDYKTFDVKEIIQKENKLILKSDEEELEFDKIIIATGNKRKKINLPEIPGVSYCAICDGNFYKNKKVAIVGGGDSAFSEALYLSNICEKVYILIRNQIKAKQDIVEKVNQVKNIEILLKKEVIKVNGKEKLESLILNDNSKIEVSGLFVSIGGTPNNEFIKSMDIKMTNGKINVNSKMQTNVKNIYACGDIIEKDYYQIATAINDGIIAALTIAQESD